MNKKAYKHWHTNFDHDNILWLHFDRQKQSTNTISSEVLDELEAILDNDTKANKLAGLVIASAKENGFIAGADLQQVAKFESSDEAMNFILQGQKVFDKLAALTIPTVAMIKGFCMGGGLELSLACRYRVAENSDKTRLGLPEVKLGIQPGWGGTVRLPKLVGVLSAMDMMLSGRAVRASAAQRMGLVDAAVPERQLRRAAQYYINHEPVPRKASLLHYHFMSLQPMRVLISKILLKKVSQKAREEHYPAPYKMINNWVSIGNNEKQAMAAEVNSIVELLSINDTSKNLVRVFFLQEQLKSLGDKDLMDVKHVHVIGAGVMGGDIAAWCALRGFHVTLQDRGPEYIAPAVKRAAKLYKKKLKKPRLIQAALDRLTPDPDGFGVGNADVIIEAIYENVTAKQELFTWIEEHAKETAILATNTSSIPLDEINKVLKEPKRLVGIHFFNPVAMMPLVEVVKGKKTTADIIKKANSFVRQIDRLPLPVKSSPGFLVNRVLMPYLMECMAMIEEGISAPLIDKAALEFGMPMGPVELADVVGLDVCLSVAKNLSEYYGGDIPKKLEAMVARKDLGKKTGKGFYEYKQGKVVKPKVERFPELQKKITERLIMRMVNEAAACLREGVVDDADLLDAGMIFGTGFAPFRGGPMHYAESLGENQMHSLFQDLEQQFGKRFKADKQWDELQAAS